MSFASQTAVILPFARPVRSTNRMTKWDREDALEWEAKAVRMGYTRVAYDHSAPDDQPELGDFMLIYATGAMWASWGVGCCDGGFMVWSPSTGTTISWHASIRRALASIPPAEGSGSR